MILRVNSFVHAHKRTAHGGNPSARYRASGEAFSPVFMCGNSVILSARSKRHASERSADWQMLRITAFAGGGLNGLNMRGGVGPFLFPWSYKSVHRFRRGTGGKVTTLSDARLSGTSSDCHPQKTRPETTVCEVNLKRLTGISHSKAG